MDLVEPIGPVSLSKKLGGFPDRRYDQVKG
jgi:hypothetical protein